MSKSARSLPTIRRPRDGDGAPVQITKRTVASSTGGAVVEFAIKLDDAPVPQRRYHADLVNVMPSNDSVRLVFGQRRVVGESLRSLLVANMTPDGVRQFLATCEAFHPALRAFIDRNQIVSPEPGHISEEPAQTVSMPVNLIAAAQFGREVMLDMYHMSAWTLREAKDREHVSVDPMVRIDLNVGLVVTLLDLLAEIAHNLPEDVR